MICVWRGSTLPGYAAAHLDYFKNKVLFCGIHLWRTATYFLFLVRWGIILGKMEKGSNAEHMVYGSPTFACMNV